MKGAGNGSISFFLDVYIFYKTVWMNDNYMLGPIFLFWFYLTVMWVGTLVTSRLVDIQTS